MNPPNMRPTEGVTRLLTIEDFQRMADQHLTAQEQREFETAKQKRYFVCDSRKPELQEIWMGWCSLSHIPFVFGRDKRGLHKITVDISTAHGKISGGYQWKILDFLQSLRIPKAPDFTKLNLKTPLNLYVPSDRFVETITGIVKICEPALPHP